MSNGFAIGRVIAALDAACHDLGLLPAAAEVAARLQAPITGLFVEDENLLRLWASPAARHVMLGPAGREAPSADQIQAELRALAADAEAALAAAAARHGIPWSFQIVRGRPQTELHERTMRRDLVVVGRPRTLAGMPLPLVSALQDAVRELPHSTLHLQTQSALARPIVLAQAWSPLLERAVAAAVQLSGEQVSELVVLLIAGADDARRLPPHLADDLTSSGIRTRVRVLTTGGLDALSQALAAVPGDILVAAADIPLFRNRDNVLKLLERIGLPVLIVRG